MARYYIGKVHADMGVFCIFTLSLSSITNIRDYFRKTLQISWVGLYHKEIVFLLATFESCD
jgi:hypothetical protein